MINSLQIQNFQSHKNSELEFSKGVNIIIGASDSGKSAVIRALRWLVWNRPSGDEFRSDWGGDTKIGISSENLEVIRMKGTNKNLYYERGVAYEAFGTEVPKEIQSDLNLNEINLQQQLDRPFLLSDSPGEVAQHFNRIAHLDQIDIGLRNIQKWIRDIEQGIFNEKTQIESLEKQFESFTYLDKFEIDLEVLEEIQVKWLGKITSKNGLSKLINEIETIDIQIKNQTLLIQPENKIFELLGYYTKKKEIETNLIQLSETIEEIEIIDKPIKKLNKIISIEFVVNKILSDMKIRDSKLKLINVLKWSIKNLKEIEQEFNNTNISLINLKTKFNESFPDVCPLCGKPK